MFLGIRGLVIRPYFLSFSEGISEMCDWKLG